MDEFKYYLIAFMLFFMTIMSILLFFTWADNTLEPCNSPTKIECYRYVSEGGLFGGIREMQTSCEGEYDFYMNKSVSWKNCKPTYDKIYSSNNNLNIEDAE